MAMVSSTPTRRTGRSIHRFVASAQPEGAVQRAGDHLNLDQRSIDVTWFHGDEEPETDEGGTVVVDPATNRATIAVNVSH